ncbi:MAG: CsgG/HfaB family protein, partial [Thiohalocapsa sp.]
MKTNTLAVATISALALFTAQNAAADFVAYSVGKKSSSPLPEKISDIETKHLLNIQWGEYNGPKRRLGVLPVDNNSGSSTYSFSSADTTIDYSAADTGVPVNGIEAIVIDSLSQTGRFRLVERTELDSVLDEQDLAASGRVATPSGAKTGNVLGAEYLVQVVVTDYESNTSVKSGGAGGLLRKVPLVGGIKAGSSQGRVGLNLRLIDAETSEITFSTQIESIIKETNLGFGGFGWTGDAILGGFMSSYAKTPIGQAVIAGINEGVFELIKQVGAKPAEGTVIKADSNQVFLNVGANVASVGDRFRVMRMGEELIDPDTGISLGGSMTN